MGSILSNGVPPPPLSISYLSLCLQQYDRHKPSQQIGRLDGNIHRLPESRSELFAHPADPSATTESTTANNTLRAAPFSHSSPLSG